MESKKLKILQNKTPVQLLHEKLARCGSSVRYQLVYDWTTRPVNVPKFTWEIKVGDQTAFGTDNNKKKAKQEAARNMLMQLSDDVEMLTALPANTGDNMQNHIGNLSMFCSRNELPQPKYDEDLEDGPAHKRRFYWNCVVGQHREVGVAHSTKAAKQLAAQAMYLALVQSMNNPNDADVPDYKLSTETMTLCKIEKSEKHEPETEIANDSYSPASPDPVGYAISSEDSVPVRSPGKRERTDDSSSFEDEDCDNLNNSVTARSDYSRVVKRRRSTSFSSEEALVKYKIL
ncbi:interferon-inducible double-stranded RNA-dependent protein kinase activator A homolog isoform X1 [Diachasmimorpha longicaudata]|uniref:interferon-inducible double-stranded RNA-dependent protein kinase activator A homolog isoform X1 n=1 Tax=Diachasmimorpha longicaudata TaxID=58733 RepID=UPI0030B89479